ncbi:GMP synthase [glutamine-hydrolyzing] [Clostridia bacterium]|nr:GMP synthase [glutamine-hydrolyzing] [Clostridia bacterium]
MEKVAILDCGGQYTKVIDRKVRECLVDSEILAVSVDAGALEGFSGIILTGGPESVWEENSLRPDPRIFELGIPILGICYGMHLVAAHFGGVVASNVKKEYGEADIEIDNSVPLFDGLGAAETVLMSHGDSVSAVPAGFVVCGRSGNVTAAICDAARRVHAVQFHPEVDLTINGMKIFENFLRKICGIKDVYSLENRLNTAVSRVREVAGDRAVIVLVSGGVDSAVTAEILLRALPPDNIIAVHVDHGLMRKNESDGICDVLQRGGLKRLIRIDAKDVFFAKLAGVSDPEKKRAIIGETFITELQNEVDKLELDLNSTFLAQGTLRPDLIESGNPDISASAAKIKTHHNDVDIIRTLRDKGLVIETNYDWHKDEVRKIAKMLGLTDEIANRQPFPGPGLGVRLLCGDGTKTVSANENEKLTEFLKNERFSGCILPVSSVGVQGDKRTYKELAALYSDTPAYDWDELYSLARNITNNFPFINRVAYAAGGHNGIEKAVSHSMYVCDESVNLLREIDNIVTERLKDKKISQTFAVLLPVGYTKKYSVAIRTFVTNDFMTGRPYALPFARLNALAEEIKKGFSEIEYVFYDITAKPPATCEWE